MALTALGALAHETRLDIFRTLVRQGPKGLAAGEIGAALGIAPTTLSFHLSQLSHAGLVTARRDGRFIYYAAAFPAIGALLRYLVEDCCHGVDLGAIRPVAPKPDIQETTP